MPEIKVEVRPIEVDYECDACGKGMMSVCAEQDPATGEFEHRCLICDHKQFFHGRYPRIDYVELDEKV